MVGFMGVKGSIMNDIAKSGGLYHLRMSSWLRSIFGLEVGA